MANNAHGMVNEKEMVTYLDGTKIKDLNLTCKEFIKYICLTKDIPFDENTTLSATYEENNKLKQDFYIKLNNVEIGVSLKMGVGNSCHQEKIEDFLSFIQAHCNATEEICDLWRFFIWADGTLDGRGSVEKDSNGKIKSRFNSTTFKQIYPEKRILLQKFLDENSQKLIERALFVGKYNSNVEFVYHGTYKQGRWISKKEVLNFLTTQSRKSNRACLSIGNLTIQAWNVSLRGNTEHKRGEIQIKYGAMQEDFNTLMRNNASTIGTFLGELEEFDLTKTMNRNKESNLWNILLPKETDFSNYFLTKVSSTQFSALSQTKVKTKSDAYVIKANIPREFLLEKEFVLDESDLSNFSYETVAGTGISIKMKQSSKYTYQKLTKNSFCKAFSGLNDPEFWLTTLLIYSNDKERYKNYQIITDLGNTIESFLAKVDSIIGINTENTDCSGFWNSVRKNGQNKIKNYIIANPKLAESIFTGKYWFDSPYHADYIFENGVLKKNTVPSFGITTGSGRSRRNYSIEIIPLNK